MMHTAETPRQKLVIGNGMAAGRVLDELFARASDRYDVTMFGAEPRVNYDRIMLSPVLAGEKQFNDIIVHHEDWYAPRGFSEGDEKDEIVLRDPARGVYKRVVLRQNRIVGAVLYGDTADGSWYFNLLKQSADITSNLDMLIFGQAYQGGGAARSQGRHCCFVRRC
jgi:NAD(P)H-nitrite reductase large subunit